jgi:hypothetical protein
MQKAINLIKQQLASDVAVPRRRDDVLAAASG